MYLELRIVVSTVLSRFVEALYVLECVVEAGEGVLKAASEVWPRMGVWMH